MPDLKPIVLYDIPGTIPAKAWSPNTWKARYSLSYKGLPYKTVWVEYPDIAAISKKIGAPPTEKNADGSPAYTLPAIYDPNTAAVVAESVEIAEYLDKTYPEKPRILPTEADPLIRAFIQAHRSTIYPDLLMIMLPATHDQLGPRGQIYFRTTREKLFGTKLEDFAPAGSEKREKHWKGFEDALDKFAQWLEGDGKDRPFFYGDQISFPDITLASTLLWIRLVLGEDSKEWKDISTWNGGRWVRLMEAFKKYEKVDVGEDAQL